MNVVMKLIDMVLVGVVLVHQETFYFVIKLSVTVCVCGKKYLHRKNVK